MTALNVAIVAADMSTLEIGSWIFVAWHQAWGLGLRVALLLGPAFWLKLAPFPYRAWCWLFKISRGVLPTKSNCVTEWVASTEWKVSTWAARACGTRPPTSNRTPHQRVATQSLHHGSCTIKGWTFDTVPPASAKKKSNTDHLLIPPFTSRAFTTIPRTNNFAYIPVPLFPDPSASFFWLPPPLVCTNLPVRSYFRLPSDNRAVCTQSRVLRRRGEPHLNAQQPECAAKPVHGSPPTLAWPTHRFSAHQSHCKWLGALGLGSRGIRHPR